MISQSDRAVELRRCIEQTRRTKDKHEPRAWNTTLSQQVPVVLCAVRNECFIVFVLPMPTRCKKVRIKPRCRMLGEAAVHADGVWKLQNDSTKEMTAQVKRIVEANS